MPGTGTLILLRHGQSVFNAEGRFTGLLDPPLTARGRSEAVYAATLISGFGLHLDDVLTSTLMRAVRTAEIVTECLGLSSTPRRVWQLNERNYGSLTGRLKSELLAEFGPDVLHFWRRSLYGAPPPMDAEALGELWRTPALAQLPARAVRGTESLCEVLKRVREFWHQHLRRQLLSGRHALIVGHGNSLRALCLLLDGLSEGEVERLNLPTGHPLVYELDERARPLERGGIYLDPQAARFAAKQVTADGGT